MERFLDNPRRFPRVPVRLAVAVAASGGGFSAETEDVSPGGCLIVSPRPLVQGVQLRLAIDGPDAGARLSVLGQVAWALAAEQLRAGVAFQGRLPGGVTPEAWFRRILTSEPGMMARMSRAPERLPLDAPLYLLPPPRQAVDILDEEVALLRRIDNGVTPRALLEAAGARAATATRALFSLFEKRALTLSLGKSAPVWKWRELLARLEGGGALDHAQVVEMGGAAPASPSGPGVPVRQEPPRLAREISAAPGAAPPPLPSSHPARPRPPPLRGAPPQPPVPPPLPRAPEPGTHRVEVRPRGLEAQQCLDAAVRASQAGNFHTAIGLLRRALQLSPRDPEISALLGKLAFRDGRI